MTESSAISMASNTAASEMDDLPTLQSEIQDCIIRDDGTKSWDAALRESGSQLCVLGEEAFAADSEEADSAAERLQVPCQQKSGTLENSDGTVA